MPPRQAGVTWRTLLGAGLRRELWQAGVKVLAAAMAAGALCAVLLLLVAMGRLLEDNTRRLGADLVVAPQGLGAVVERYLSGESAESIAASLSVEEVAQHLEAAEILGVQAVEGWVLEDGNLTPAAGDLASVVLIHVAFWQSPQITSQALLTAAQEVEVVVTEQVTRQVTRDLQPLVRALGAGALVGLLAAVLITGVLTSLSVAQRLGELGMLRSVGATRAFLVGLVLCEAGITSLTGGGLGAAGAAGALHFFGRTRWLAEHLSATEWFLLPLAVAAVTALAAALSALGPALQAGRMDPVTAARRGQ